MNSYAQDKEDIIYACNHNGDFLALSFVSCKEDILNVEGIGESLYDSIKENITV